MPMEDPYSGSGPSPSTTFDPQLPNTPSAELRLMQASTTETLMGDIARGVTYGAMSLPVSIADTFASSLIPGVDKNDMTDFLERTAGGFGTFYKEHTDGIQAVSGLVGALIPGMVMAKTVRAGGWLAGRAEATLGTKAASYITSTGKSNTELFEALYQQARLRGAQPLVANLAKDATWMAAKGKAVGRSVADTVIETAAAEIGIAASMHTNGFLYPEELSFGENALWSAGTTGVVAGAASLIARRTMHRGIAVAMAEARVDNLLDSQKMTALAAGNVVDARGPALATRGQLLQDAATQHDIAKTSMDTMAVTAALTTANSVRAQSRDIVQNLFRDSPVEDVTLSHSFGDEALAPQVATIMAGLEQSPLMAAGIRSLERFDSLDAPQELVLRRRAKLETQKGEMIDLQIKIDKLSERSKRSIKQENELRRLTNKLDDTARSFEDLNRSAVLVNEIDGSISTATGRAAIWQDGPRTIDKAGFNSVSVKLGNRRLTSTQAGHVLLESADPNAHQLTGDAIDAFDIHAALGNTQPIDVPKLGQAEWRGLSHWDRTAVQDLLQNQAERANPTLMRGPIKLGADSHHTQLDYAIAFLKHNKQSAAAWDRVEGFTDLPALEMASIRQKFFDYQWLRNQADGSPETSIYRNSDNVARALNLPRDRHTLTYFMEANRVKQGPVADLGLITPDAMALRSAVRTHAGMDGQNVAAMQNDVIELIGNQMQQPKDRKPVISLIRNLSDNAAPSAEDLARAVTTQRAIMLTGLRDAPDSVIVKPLMDTFDSMRDVMLAFKNDIHSVVEGNGLDGGLLKNLWQQPFRYRELNAYKSASLMQDMIGKALDKQIEGMLKSPAAHGRVVDETAGVQQSHQDIFGEIVTRGNEYDLDMYQAFRHARGAGWDVADEGFVLSDAATGSGEELFHVRLADTPKNAAIWRSMFGDSMPKQAFMPMSGQQQLVALSVKARNAALSVSEFSGQLLKEHNTLMRQMGFPEVEQINLHLPAQDLTEGVQKFVVDGRGQFQFVVGGSTKRAAEANADKELAAAKEQGRELFVLDESDMERFKYAGAESWFKMSDYSKPSNQTGTAKGTSFGGLIKTGQAEFQNTIEAMLRQYSDIGRRMTSMIMDPEIQYLKLQKGAAGFGNTDKTVFDDVISALNGSQNLDANSVVGKGLLGVESVYDSLMQRVWDTIEPRKPNFGSDVRSAERKVANAQARFPIQFQPFKSVEDYISGTIEGGAPGTLRKHAAALNKLVAEVSIRMFDVGMMMINGMSLASTLPAVTAALLRRTNENETQWMRRIGVYGTVTPKGGFHFSGTKALTTGIHMRFTDEGRDILKRADKKGLLVQAAAEQEAIWNRGGNNAISRGWTRFANAASRGVDWSERESRAIPFLAFHKIGTDGLGLTDDAAMMFAHQQSNNVIADFRPSSRPAIFQGAAGMPLGLFTTYMWNFMQRNVDMIENMSVAGGKAWQKPIAVQIGLQSSLFGASSLPGWDLYTSHFGQNYDGSHNIVDTLTESMGSVGADLFLNGTISNLPKLFGMEGINVSSRASVGLPFQYGVGFQGAAGIRFIGKTAEMFGNALDRVRQDGGIDPAAMAEIYAQANINKMTSGVAEWMVGHSLDTTGNVIEENTRTWSGTAARILGSKPLFADMARQENARNRTTDRIRGEMMADLGQQMRSKFRNGKVDAEVFDDMLTDYSRAGGSPVYLGRWMQSQLLLGTQDKTSRALANAMNDSIQDGRIGRMLYLQRD